MLNSIRNGTHIAALFCALAAAIPAPALSQAPAETQTPPDATALARDIFKQLIEINTTDSVGNVTTAAEAMAKRLRDAGFPEKDVIVAGPNERK